MPGPGGIAHSWTRPSSGGALPAPPVPAPGRAPPRGRPAPRLEHALQRAPPSAPGRAPAAPAVTQDVEQPPQQALKERKRACDGLDHSQSAFKRQWSGLKGPCGARNSADLEGLRIRLGLKGLCLGVQAARLHRHLHLGRLRGRHQAGLQVQVLRVHLR